MNEKKWISPQLLAGYGLATWIGYHAMEKVAIAFSDLGSVNGLGIGGFTGTWGHIASSSLFVPCVCILSVVPFVIHVCSYIPRSWKQKASSFRSDAFEFPTDSPKQLVDSSRENELSSDSVVSTPSDSSLEVFGSNRIRQDRMGEMDNVVSLHDEATKRGTVRNRRPKRRK